MRGIRLYAIVAAAFMAGAFLASPELRAYAANTIGSADIINNSILSVDIKDGEVKTVDVANNAVTSAKIKDGEVKTDDIAPSAIGSLRIKDNDVKEQDLAPDSVGASEMMGVTKLIFTACSIDDPRGFSPGTVVRPLCFVPGMTSTDRAIVTKEFGNPCYALTGSEPREPAVLLFLKNVCNQVEAPGIETFNILIYKPG